MTTVPDETTKVTGTFTVDPQAPATETVPVPYGYGFDPSAGVWTPVREEDQAWTAQMGSPPPQPVYPGQVLTTDQLPDPAGQTAMGVDPEVWRGPCLGTYYLAADEEPVPAVTDAPAPLQPTASAPQEVPAPPETTTEGSES